MPVMYAEIECTVLTLDTVGIFTNLATCSIGPFRFAVFEQQAMLQIMLVTAADQGLADAQYTLVSMYFDGEGVSQDYDGGAVVS